MEEAKTACALTKNVRIWTRNFQEFDCENQTFVDRTDIKEFKSQGEKQALCEEVNYLLCSGEIPEQQHA